jgi:hypothetical protein
MYRISHTYLAAIMMSTPTVSARSQPFRAMGGNHPIKSRTNSTYEAAMQNPRPYDRSSVGWMLATSNLENELEEDAVLGLMNLKHDKTQTLGENSTANDSSETADGSSSTLSGSSVDPDVADSTRTEFEQVNAGDSNHVDQPSTNASQQGHTERKHSSQNKHENGAKYVELSTTREETHSGPEMSQMTMYQLNTAEPAQFSAEEREPPKGPNRKTVKAKELEALIESKGIPNPNGTCIACRRRNLLCKVLDAQRAHVCGLCSGLKQKCEFED